MSDHIEYYMLEATADNFEYDFHKHYHNVVAFSLFFLYTPNKTSPGY